MTHTVLLLRGTVEVAEIAVEVSGQLHVGPPKMRASRRTVSLPAWSSLSSTATSQPMSPRTDRARFTAPEGRAAAAVDVLLPLLATGYCRRRP